MHISGKPVSRLGIPSLYDSLSPLVDYKIDRPGVEAQQCVELTGTNWYVRLNLIR